MSSPTPTPQDRASPPSPHTTPEPKKKPTLRILCFGDSLSAGYPSGRPYSAPLAAALSRAFPALHVDAHADGRPGDSAAAGFPARIEPRFLARGGGGTPYDWTVVLGGTNDLAAGLGAAAIFAALRGVWAVPLSKGGRVLACTVPEAGGIGGKVAEGIARRRGKLNDMIRGHRQENFHVFDLEAAIPFWSMREEERSRYWDDDVHLSAEGYGLMGEKIAARLVELIMPPGRLQAAAAGARPLKRRRVFKDDDKTFEEEDGDDSLLDQGYIVVRRKDLE